MFAAEATHLMQQALWLVIVLSAPPIAAAAITGLVVAILQSATQVQEQTLQYAVKFAAIALALFLTMAMIGETVLNFARQVFDAFPTLAGS